MKRFFAKLWDKFTLLLTYALLFVSVFMFLYALILFYANTN